MPEYLAPAVYIEELPSGNKPIEGASTSTAGMVGVTERGPVAVPTLVTSFGAYARIFGGVLDHRVFTDGLDSLPYAAQGFFANGGQRLYVTRVLGAGAERATATLWGVGSGSTTLAARAGMGDKGLSLASAAAVSAASGVQLLIADGERAEVATVSASTPATKARLTLNAPLTAAHAAADPVVVQTVTLGNAVAVTVSMAAGDVLGVNPIGLKASDVIQVRDTGDPSRTEFVTITTDDLATIAEAGMRFDHPLASTEAHVVTFAPAAAATTLRLAAGAAATELEVEDAAAFKANDIVTVGAERRLVLAAQNATLLDVASLAAPLLFNHAANVVVAQAQALMVVHARDSGLWGNALRIRASGARQLDTTLAQAALANALGATLTATFGLFVGSVLDLGAAGRHAVIALDRPSGEVTFATQLKAALPLGNPAQSVEFNLSIERLDAGRIVESEAFERMALDPRHPRYAPRLVGSFNSATKKGSVSGASQMVRLSDSTLNDDGTNFPDDATAAARRLGQPSGGAVFGFTDGDDNLDALTDKDFVGVSAEDPDKRTGIQAMDNELALSMVAVPGRTSVEVQNALLIHCERMRYRFAVLETPVDATLAVARTHRQNYDSTRGAIYYPWLVIPDGFGEKGDLRSIPPAGHVLGIYARTDVTRGVWKAPANEVVQGILQFATTLTKGEQDILNPLNVNCFRDFRSVGRGLRLWGARTLSSDPEMKYVSVRRLLLFIEQSLDTGLQWAVFEPNAEPLWATVKQSITGFLTTVWRDGGLEGVTPEEAFFVQIGFNVTMTQTDIDLGRLIVVIGVAPVKPAEFVIVRISQKTREALA